MSGLADWQRRQPACGEDSLTDWLLDRLSVHLRGVYYRRFNRYEEGRTFGADWDWWIVAGTAALHLRVQAKKLSPEKDNYPGLAYANRHGLQIEMLEDRARRDLAYPMYVLYSPGVGGGSPRCPSAALCRASGAWIASAGLLHATFIAPGRRKVNMVDVIDLTRPLACLFCCPKVGGDSSGPLQRFRTLLLSLNDGLPQDENAADRLTPELPTNDALTPQQVPDWVAALMRDSREPGLSEQWEAEVGLKLPDVAGVLILDATTST